MRTCAKCGASVERLADCSMAMNLGDGEVHWCKKCLPTPSAELIIEELERFMSTVNKNSEEKSMNFTEYQAAAKKTAIYPKESLFYPALGLAGEAGEVANKVKKLYRGDLTKAELKEALSKELGDCCWYIAALCDEMGLDMGEVAELNVKRLADRQARGALGGSGDDR